MILVGLMWGIVFYFIAVIIALAVYRLYSPWYTTIFLIIILCGLGHFYGTYAYSLVPSDSLYTFFSKATPIFSGLSTEFVENITWYVRAYLTDDSFLGTLYFFSAFAYLGSVLWYLLFLRCSQHLKIENQSFVFPALIIMCWPSYFFFTTGIGKDSLCFFFIPLMFLTWNHVFHEKNSKYIPLILLVISIFLLAMIRPYLLIILSVAYYFSIFKKLNEFSMFRVLSIIILIPIVGYILFEVVTKHGGLKWISLESIGKQALVQQTYQNTGSSFPMLSNDPMIVLLLLPYSFIMNLFFPLFFLANNTPAILASFENLLLVGFAFKFMKRFNWFLRSTKQLPILKLMFNFFLVGMMLMSLINTNLGLAMRQKSMYVPAFFVLVMLLWLDSKTKDSAV